MMPVGRHSQQGSTLLISVVLLLVLTLMALGGVSSSALQERMAHNAQRMNLGFQAAESGLRHVEQQLNLQELMLPASVCSGGGCDVPAALLRPGASGSPGPEWQRVPTAITGEETEVWFRIVQLGDSALAVNIAAGATGTLYRVSVLSRRDSSPTLLEAVYAYSRL